MTGRCQDFESRLGVLLEPVADAEEVHAVRAHVSTCASCRGVLQDLTRLQTAARGLGPITPPDHVWLHVAGQLRVSGAMTPAPARRAASLVPWLGLAAALVLVTLGVYLVTQAPAPVPSDIVASNAGSSDPVETAVEELSKAAKHYENAMIELEKLAAANDGDLDPTLATMLRNQLELADRAIAESRQAMQSDPTSQPARDSLFEAFRRKVGVLQATVSLMNEMRRGNPGGAADAALPNKKG